ncbi:hypothetical protein F4821DRAFT_161302 [Hypoxylon rubiginosum]|uniref:Uncharacterized protein n=1 Tax=Hypoxylon rubiginosum TaxID=110542 RepID=A0ACC0CY85_9PEZI|nr:hypothetical protein F4821DRAFT_161302 [Hypoxylon rubiginosum]
MGRDIRVTENLDTKQRNRVGTRVSCLFSKLRGTKMGVGCARAQVLWGAANTTGLMFMSFFPLPFFCPCITAFDWGARGYTGFPAISFALFPRQRFLFQWVNKRIIKSLGVRKGGRLCVWIVWRRKNSVCIGNHIRVVKQSAGGRGKWDIPVVLLMANGVPTSREVIIKGGHIWCGPLPYIQTRSIEMGQDTSLLLLNFCRPFCNVLCCCRDNS